MTVRWQLCGQYRLNVPGNPHSAPGTRLWWGYVSISSPVELGAGVSSGDRSLGVSGAQQEASLALYQHSLLAYFTLPSC